MAEKAIWAFVYGRRYKLTYQVPGEKRKTKELNYLGSPEPGLMDFGDKFTPQVQLWREDIKTAIVLVYEDGTKAV